MNSIAASSPWASVQTKSALHWGSVLSYALIIFISHQWPPFLFIGFIVFLLVTSLHMIWKMLIFIAVVSLLLAVLPFLAPIAFIAMVVLFIMRIGYVIENWRPVLLGLLFYGSAVPLYGSVAAYYYSYDLFTPLIMAVIGAVLLHFALSWIYSHGYSAKTALGIMGSVPLVILAFILPFLKLHIPAPDVFLEGAPASGSHVGTGDAVLKPEVRPVVGSQSAAVGNSPVEALPAMAEAKPVVPLEKTYTGNASVHAALIDSTPSSQPVNFNPEVAIAPEPESIFGFIQAGPVQLQSNIYGGYDFLQDGMTKIISHSNTWGGQDFLDNDGQKIVYTQPNAVVGHDVLNPDNQLVYRTSSNALGGYDIFNESNQKVAYTSAVDAGGNIDVFDKNNSKIGNLKTI